jgi:NADPH:quinone reductase-like Zn-dependent oxidoreductase
MKASFTTKYGSADVLLIKEIDKPNPKKNEILVKIYSASVTAADTMMRKGKPYLGRLFIGLRKPKYAITGTGFAGKIESMGDAVTQFNMGDNVFGESIFATGTNAEYVCIPEDALISKMPATTTYDEAAPICDGALTSLSFLKDIAQLQPGQSVLINGASGSLGTSALQIAKHFGAHVTGVCSTENISMVKALGADNVIDYTCEDFTEQGQHYDVIFDTVGKSSFLRCKQSLTKQGIYLSPVFSFRHLIQMQWAAKTSLKKAKFSATGMRPVAELRPLINELTTLFEQGKIKTVVDRHYPLDAIVDAHQYVDQGHKKGNIVLRMVNI